MFKGLATVFFVWFKSDGFTLSPFTRISIFKKTQTGFLDAITSIVKKKKKIEGTEINFSIMA